MANDELLIEALTEEEKQKQLEELLRKSGATLPSGIEPLTEAQQREAMVKESPDIKDVVLPEAPVDQTLFDKIPPVAAPTVPEASIAPEVPSPAEEAVPQKSLLEQYKEAQKERRKALSRVGLREAGAQMGAAIAGYGAKAGDYKTARALAALPVEELESQIKFQGLTKDLEDKQKLSDPTSGVSKVYKEFVKQTLGFDIPEDTSAADLQKMGLKIPSASEKRRYRAVGIYNEDTGQIEMRTFDSATGKWMEKGDEEKMVRGFAGRAIKSPEEEELFYFQPGAGVPKRKQYITGPKAEEERKEAQRGPAGFSKGQERDIQLHTKRFEDNTKNQRKSLIAAKKLLGELKPGYKLTEAIIRTQMPRLMGEVGNLAEFEQKIWTGSPEIKNAVKRAFLRRLSAGDTLTEIDIKLLKSVIKRTSRQVQDEIDRFRGNTVNRMVQDAKITPEQAHDYLGKPIQVSKPKVRVRLPDGRVGLIPAEKLGAAMKKGAIPIDEVTR
jgi:hypothetical protein